MGRRKRATPPEDVAEVRRRIQKWRKTRKKRTRMPEELWSAAAGLARVHGVHPISQALRVNYESLRNRVRAGVPAVKGEDKTAAFVELQPAWLDAAPRCTVELREPSGTTMTIKVTDPRELDVVRLLDGFWSRRR